MSDLPSHCFTLYPLRHDEALTLVSLFEDALDPEALAVSLSERDETTESWELIAYYRNSEEAGRAVELARRHGLAEGEVSPLPQIDWVRRSLEGLPPVWAGRFMLYGSHDRALRRPNGIALEIDAGTAFGTGHHGTTRGCLLALDLTMKRRRPRRVLDVGTGTGVLAIAAAKALRQRVLASDIDPEAVTVTRANARRNGAGPLLGSAAAAGTSHALIRNGAPYDLIFANILARPLIKLAPSLARLLVPGGRVILSGLTTAQERQVTAAYRAMGLVTVTRIRLEGWSTLVMDRR